MRTVNTAKNLAGSLSLTLIMVPLGFISRKIFIDTIGVEYLGLNGLLSNVLGIMSLLEGGFAASVVYNMYKPLAEDNRPMILSLVQLYKTVYRWIGLALVAFAVCLYPFLPIFINDSTSLPYLSFVYFIFVFNTVVNYFTAHKLSLINASQKAYKLAITNICYQIGLTVGRISVLYYTHNYILYLILEAVFGVCLNLVIVHKCNKLFPYIVTPKKYRIDPEVRHRIIRNMKALFINKIGGFLMHSTDNIIISSFLGLSVVGLYSNYSMITALLRNLSDQLLNSYSESAGNLIASSENDQVYEVFKVAFFVDFIVNSFIVIIFANTINPFICWWLGKDYVLSNFVLLAILLNMYLLGMRGSAYIFKTKAGLFMQDRFSPFIQSVINVALSVWLVHIWQLAGVLLATAISLMSIGVWQFPHLCYKHIFHRPLSEYFIKYFTYALTCGATLFLSHLLCELVIFHNNLLQAIVNGIISLFTIIVVYWFLFRRSYQYVNTVEYIKATFSNLFNKSQCTR